MLTPVPSLNSPFPSTRHLFDILPFRLAAVVVLKPSVPTTFLASHLSEVTAHHSSSSLADDPEAGITNIYDSERLVELDSVVTTQETELGAPWVRPTSAGEIQRGF
jgi:hypothetical protein